MSGPPAMTPVPSMRSDSPRCAGQPSPEREELLADLAELDSAIETGGAVLAAFIANTAAAGHIGGIDQEYLRKILIETLNDQLHPAREWLNSHLDETP